MDRQRTQRLDRGAEPCPEGPPNWLLGPGDLDGDGRADLLSRDGRGRLWLLPGSPGGGLGPRRLVAEAFERFHLAG